MKARTKVILVIGIFLILLLAWAPWITNEYAINKVRSNPNFISQHQSGIQDFEINVFWLPFGKGVTTYEGLWYVSFFGFVI